MKIFSSVRENMVDDKNDKQLIMIVNGNYMKSAYDNKINAEKRLQTRVLRDEMLLMMDKT